MWWGGGLVTGVGVGCAGCTGSAADRVDGETRGATQLVGDGSEGGVCSPGEVTTSNRGKPARCCRIQQVGVITSDTSTGIDVNGAYQVVDSGGGAVAAGVGGVGQLGKQPTSVIQACRGACFGVAVMSDRWGGVLGDGAGGDLTGSVAPVVGGDGDDFLWRTC